MHGEIPPSHPNDPSMQPPSWEVPNFVPDGWVDEYDSTVSRGPNQKTNIWEDNSNSMKESYHSGASPPQSWREHQSREKMNQRGKNSENNNSNYEDNIDRELVRLLDPQATDSYRKAEFGPLDEKFSRALDEGLSFSEAKEMLSKLNRQYFASIGRILVEDVVIGYETTYEGEDDIVFNEQGEAIG